MTPPTAYLSTTRSTTRLLVRVGDDEVLKAVLRPSSCSEPHVRAIPTLLEAVALWHQAQVRVVLSAAEAETWWRMDLVDELYLGRSTAHYTVEVHEPVHDRRRGRRIDGLGSFTDLRQLALRGTR